MWRKLPWLWTPTVELRQMCAKPLWQMASQNKACCNSVRWSKSVDIYLSFRQNGYFSQRAISFWYVLSRIPGEDLGVCMTKWLKVVAESPGGLLWWSETGGTRDESRPGHRKGRGQSPSGRPDREKNYSNQLNTEFREWESRQIQRRF